MSRRHKKSGNNLNLTEKVILVTAILDLIKTILEMVGDIIK